MKKTLFILIILFIYSCETVNKTMPISKENLNGLEIDLKLINAISKTSKKNVEDNSVIRFKSIEENSKIQKSYDSIITGVKIKSVNEEIALDIMEKYSDKVKATNNHLFLTNLEYDESSNLTYDIVITKTNNQLELIKLIGTKIGSHDYTDNDVIKWFEQRQNEFDFDLQIVDRDLIIANLKSEPKSFSELGRKIYEFCPDVIEFSSGNLEQYINYIKSEKQMKIWWYN